MQTVTKNSRAGKPIGLILSEVLLETKQCGSADLRAVESEAVGYHRNAAEGHRQGGHDRMQLAQKNRNRIKGIQDAGSDGDEDNVVSESP